MADPGLVADIAVNVFGAAGLVAVSWGLGRSSPNAPVAQRTRVVLVLAAIFFISRSLAWATGGTFLIWTTLVLAVAMPVAALIVAEGLIRRHAPKLLKLVLPLAGLVAVVVALVPGLDAVTRTTVLLAAVVGGFVAVGIFLARRDRASLSEGENATVRRVVGAMVLLAPLIVTDFRGIWPGLPVRFGALGALVMLFVGFGPASMGGRGTERLLALVVYAVIAGIVAFGVSAGDPGADPQQSIRNAAIALSGLIFAALFSELVGARAERRRAADPLLEARDAADFVARLSAHELVGDARILTAEDLAPLAHPGFDRLLRATPVLRAADAPWDRAKTDDGVERAVSLLTTYGATHAMLLSHNPLRIAVMTLPQAVADARMESELRAAQRIGELVFEREARA